ncbi:YqiA/YcfP family alpha/beta fold hydrolase [Idiomarina xiamenensis]|uniref:Putative esterase n=1 Tax=Idiomarina xiamenensis 10-D-4 TaxID=740709 RepID=K2KMN4_9GAMM|nr:YqiA/YcfP family alpha/beta fold hydrolase [Idiomarina xiamenensis]EKE83694.1 Putative esterase [Idiomarina xiamenensis 10-D-4]
MWLYLHGFESSPASEKAVLVGDFLRQQLTSEQSLARCYQVPAIPATVTATRELLMGLVEQHRQTPISGIVGSSLGGFWAHWLASQLACRALLINPAVYPAQLLQHYAGERIHPYSGERYHLQQADLDGLRQMQTELRDDAELWVLLQRGDETLDYRLAASFYRHQRLTIEAGGNHRFAGFSRYLPALQRFFSAP